MDQLCSNQNEQVIKNNLIHLYNEDITINLHRRSLISCIYFPQAEEVSDWANRSKFHSSASKVSDHISLKSSEISKKISNTTFIPRETNIFRNRYEKKSYILSPINVKFCNRPKTKIHIPKKKKQSYCCPNSLSVNQHNRKSIVQTPQLKNGLIKPRIALVQNHQANYLTIVTRKLPKTQMVSSIVRVMKRRQIVSCIKKRFEKV